MTGFEPWTSVLEATTLPTEPQPLPHLSQFLLQLLNTCVSRGNILGKILKIWATSILPSGHTDSFTKNLKVYSKLVNFEPMRA